jgi:hypothetical protein
MYKVVVTIVQLQFLLLLVWLVCVGVAGEQNAPFWFALVSVTIFFVLVFGFVAERRRR